MVSGSLDVSNSFVSPYSNSSVSYCDWWCPALRMSPLHLFPLKAIHLSPSLAGGVRLSGYLQFIRLPLSNSFVSQSGWWCPALRMSPIHLSSPIASHLSPSLAGGVRLSGCLQFICLPSQQFICLPVWLVVSGSPDVFAVAAKVSQLLPSLLRLRSSLPPVSQMWSPSCLLDVSQVRLPRCCLPVASKVSTLVV